MPLAEAHVGPAADRKRESLAGDREVVLAPGQDITVLVADDNETNRDVLVRLLRHAGFKTVDAVNGKDAVDKLRAHDIPLALMDIRMPTMSGTEATVVIRNDKGLCDTKVVAVSASVFADVHPDSAESLFDDFVPKPICADDIFCAIEKHLGVTFVEISTEVAAVASDTESDTFDIRAVDAALAGRTAEKLRGSVEMGDIAAASAIAAEIERREPALAQELGRLGRAFDLTGLESLASDLRDRSRSS